MSIWGGLLPKTETQALQFIRSNPSYDGKGIVVGILDTGVDPAAVGLQVCPDGRPKVIDVVDCTGSGDIHMGDWIVKDADADTLTVGVDGKKIMLNKSWTNPSGKFRYASKKAFDGLYPSRVVKTVRMDRKKQWDKHQAAAEHDLQQQQLDNLSLSSPSAGGNNDTAAADASDDAGPTAEELKSRIAALRALSSYSDAKDAGPVFDCLVWHNGEHYEAAINTAEPDPFRIGNEGVSSDFSRLQGMCNYREKRQYSRFSDVDSLTYVFCSMFFLPSFLSSFLSFFLSFFLSC
jgi:tripeptidyl-peptidase-2